MQRRIAVLALAALALGARAGEGVEMSAKSRTLAVAAAVPVRHAEAPFAESRDPLAFLFTPPAQAASLGASACDQAAVALCYDMKERRVVYRAARAYMPRIEGLTAESVSIRHDRITLRYSFR